MPIKNSVTISNILRDIGNIMFWVLRNSLLKNISRLHVLVWHRIVMIFLKFLIFFLFNPSRLHFKIGHTEIHIDTIFGHECKRIFVVINLEFVYFLGNSLFAHLLAFLNFIKTLHKRLVFCFVFIFFNTFSIKGFNILLLLLGIVFPSLAFDFFLTFFLHDCQWLIFPILVLLVFGILWFLLSFYFLYLRTLGIQK